MYIEPLHVSDLHDVRLKSLLDDLPPDSLPVPVIRYSHSLQGGVRDAQESSSSYIMLEIGTYTIERSVGR